ncbi:hypothetical protein K9L05_00595 [Candidatus Babeliales bacterium]|nr:hypothetical protein [Candidatus Babeliales bacterium]MCF7899132.1 hypothetical protein [Candidatus Babeliales bacterium]
MNKIYKIFKNKIFISIILFSIVFTILAIAGCNLWFCIDDIGSILGGLLKKSSDFLKIFSTDCRDYITPANYKFSKPNFISALYRPMHNLVFSGIYYIFGLNPYVYYLVIIFFFALNSVLIFYLLSLFIPLSLSFLGGLMFAFYRNISWLAWIGILQDPMSTFFLLVTVILFRLYILKANNFYCFFAAITFLISLLSRESYIFLPICIFLFAFLILTKSTDSFWQKIKFSLNKSYLFFVTIFLYFLIRLWAFGITTLPRTLNNMFLRFNFLSFLFKPATNSVVTSQNVCQTSVKTASDILVKTNIAINKISFSEKILNKINFLLNKIYAWIRHIFVIDSDYYFSAKFLTFMLFIFFAAFIIYSYRKHKNLLFFFFVAFFACAWPCFAAYPDLRYINPVYSVVIFTLFLGIYFFIKEINKDIFKKTILAIVLILAISSTLIGIKNNFYCIKGVCRGTQEYRKTFVKFFENNKFDKDANFIIMAAPFLSDSQYIFQAFLDNLDLKVCCVLFATLAQRGVMGCNQDYRIQRVKYDIKPFKENNKLGFRLTSQDKEHCGFWMNFSLHPLKWSKEEKAYIWTKNLPEINEWYDFSMGQFKIHERLENKVVTDIAFIFDDGWIDENTVFVIWDAEKGEYKVLDKNLF